MSREEIDPIIELLTDFDEMSFAPTTTVPDPEAYAIEWRNKLTEALQGYRKQSENVIELPCKVGDTVYVPWRWAFQQGVATVKVEEIKFYDSQMHYMFLIDMESDNECFNQSFGGWKLGKSIGETVFLTREEAERALKGGAE